MVRRTAFLALVATRLAAQAPFEGSIAMTLTGDDGKPNALTYMIKDGKSRMELGGGRGRNAETMTMIFDPGAKKMLILMASEKMYMEQNMGAAMDAAAAKAKPAKIARTGKTETIAGYTCEHVIVTEDNGDASDVCAATGLGAFQMPSAGGRGGPPKPAAWEGALADGAFPLKVQKGNKVIMEVTAIDKKKLDAALFAPPAGYEKFDMAAMMKRP